MQESKQELLSYFENITVLLLGIFFIGLPLFFLTSTSDAFALPKQVLLGVVVLGSIILMSIRMVIDGKLKMRTTPFDLPLLLFAVISFVSAILSMNRYDALTSFIPLLFGILLFFVMVNTAKTQNQILFLVAALVLGASLSALASFVPALTAWITHKPTGIGLLPIGASKTPGFNLFGSLLDQAIYFALVLPLAAYISYPVLAKAMKRTHGSSVQKSTVTKALGFAVGFVIVGIGLLTTVYMLVTTQKPLILPFETGFQTAFGFAQDTGRTFKTFLFGSGFGTYMTDFSRFKLASYNLNPALWSFTFFRSSSFILELLATTGFAGLLCFLFIIYRVVREKVMFLPIILAIIAAFLLPFSFILQTLFFILLAVFATLRASHSPKRYADLDFYFVALKHGLFQVREEGEHTTREDKEYAKVLPILFLILMLIGAGFIGYLSGRYVLSDMQFQKSLVAASQNNGQATYDLELSAIKTFPYRDSYYRIFSQTNLALANSLASAQPKNTSPSAQVQNTILQLTQQSINAGRQAVTVSPLTAINWDNLASIYRSLIGFGQNADQFAILSNQQAIALDQNNPQQYINLGGIYYQLGQWDNAIRQFALATQVKPDFANAYYNLGHAYESKGDNENALAAYNAVRQLVAQTNDKDSLKKITDEINTLQKKGTQTQTTQTPAGAGTNQPPIGINAPETKLPERNPQVNIPNPPVSPAASGSAKTK